ncbi:hypothetical protein MWU59_06125 [Flavobacteriaceae bacterium F08102]|nr:hypothetical protein [Flavobacteriaceae bacterium F08102]
MNKYSLIKELNNLDSTRESRKKIVKSVLKDQTLFQSLVEIAFDYNNQVSVNAIGVLEIIAEQKLDWFAYNLSYFTSNLSNLTNESAVKSASKICNLIAQEYNSKFDSPIKLIMTYEQLSELIEACFDWLLKEHKVSVKNQAMEALFHIGKKIKWIHYEVKLILDKNKANESPAYVSKANKILESIAKIPSA